MSSASQILAASLRKLVDRFDGSQVELSKVAGVPQKTISRALNEENAATLDTLNDLAIGLAIEPWQLLAPDGLVAPGDQELIKQLHSLPPEVQITIRDLVASLAKAAHK